MNEQQRQMLALQQDQINQLRAKRPALVAIQKAWYELSAMSIDSIPAHWSGLACILQDLADGYAAKYALEILEIDECERRFEAIKKQAESQIALPRTVVPGRQS